MIAKYMLSDGILPLKTSDTGREALEWMQDYKVTHLPIVNNEALLGVISEIDLLTHGKFDDPIGSHELTHANLQVYENQHLFEVIQLMHAHKLSLIPVLDANNNYKGCICLDKLLSVFAESFSINQPGIVVVLDLLQNDYSLEEIARIVESNDAKILSLFILSHPDSNGIQVILKINKIYAQAVLQTFTRFGYKLQYFDTEEVNREDIQEHYEALMNYLDIG